MLKKILISTIATVSTVMYCKAGILDNPDFPWFGNPKETNMTRKIAHKMRLGIWIQGRYAHIQQPDTIKIFNGADIKTNGTIDNFYIRRLRFLFIGKFLDNWRFTIHTGLAPVGKYKTDDKKLRIFDAFVAYTKWKYATFLIGREKIFFGRPFSERLPYWHNIVFPLAEKSMFLGLAGVLKELYPDIAFKLMAGAPLPFAYRIDQAPGARAPGVVMQGFLANGHFDYKLGLYNAWRDGLRGITNSDGVGYPEFLKLVRVQYNIWPEANPKLLGYKGNHFGRGKHFTIGASYYSQNDIIQKREFKDPATPVYGNLYSAKYDAEGYTVDFSGHKGAFTWRGEYMNVKNKNIQIFNSISPIAGTIPPPFRDGAKKDLELKAWWLQFAYLFPKKVLFGRPEIAVMYEYFDPDAQGNYRPKFDSDGNLIKGGSDVWKLFHITLNYYFYQEFAKFSIEYIKVKEKYQDHKNDQILAQLVFAFFP